MSSPIQTGSMIRTSREDAQPLAVMRCTAFAAGRAEPAARDGSVQMRLPLGAWIVDLVPEPIDTPAPTRSRRASATFGP